MVVTFMRMNKNWCVAVLGLMAFASLGAVSAQAAESKIAVVNIPRLLESAPQAKAMMEQLQSEFAPRQRELAALQKDLREKEETLKRDGAVMSEEERRNIERQLRDGQRDFQRKGQEMNEDANLRRNEELGKLQRILGQEIQNYARGQNFDLVLGDVIYASEGMDITDALLTALQAKFKQAN
jgi:outer membrane protein